MVRRRAPTAMLDSGVFTRYSTSRSAVSTHVGAMAWQNVVGDL